MKALIQRVEEAEVRVNDRITGRIGPGLLVFLGIREGDSVDEAQYLASRISQLRIFNDENGKMNLSVQDIGGSLLIVSQFTLHADTRKGNRPSYQLAAQPEEAEEMYEYFVNSCRAILSKERIATGEFRAMMKVSLINDGPVTVMMHSKNEYPVS